VTTRVAYLLQHYGLPPEDVMSVCPKLTFPPQPPARIHRAEPDSKPDSVVTFTNKAANEMKHRIALMLGNQAVDKLVMGTFHS